MDYKAPRNRWFWFEGSGYCLACAEGASYGNHRNDADAAKAGWLASRTVDYCCNCGRIPGTTEIKPSELR